MAGKHGSRQQGWGPEQKLDVHILEHKHEAEKTN